MEDTQNNIRNILSLSQASEQTGYHQDYLGFLCRQGKLKGFKVGRNWVTTQEAINDFLRSSDRDQKNLPNNSIEFTQAANQENSNESLSNKVSTQISSLPVTSDNKAVNQLQSLKSEVLESLEDRLAVISKTVAELESRLSSSESKEIQTQNKVLENEHTRIKDVRSQFVPNILLGSDTTSVLNTDKPSEIQTAFVKAAAGGFEKVTNSFSNKFFPYLLSASAIAIAIFVFVKSFSPVSNFEKTNYVYTSQILSPAPIPTPFQAIATSTTQTIIQNITNQNLTKLLGVDKTTLYPLIDERLNSYLAEGKFMGPVGPQGLQGPQGPAGTSAGGFSGVTYLPPVPQNNFSGGSVFSSTQLSAHSAVIDNLTTTALTVTGSETINGGLAVNSLNVSGLTQGSVIFQGSSGLTQDNSNFFYNASTTQLSLGTNTATSSAALQIDSTTKGLLAPRLTQAQRDAIVFPAAGLLVYNTDTNVYNVYNGSSWGSVGSGGGGSGGVDAGIANAFAYYQSSNATVSPQTTLYIANNKIGIGTSTPPYRLAVQNIATTTSDIFDLSSSSGQSFLHVTALGKVGVGTITPATTLDVNGTIRSTSFFTPTFGAGLELNYNPSAGNATIYAVDRDSSTYKNLNLNDKAFITSGGNIGIGTTTPLEMLSVQGGNILLSPQYTLRSLTSTGGNTALIGLDPSDYTSVYSPGNGVKIKSAASGDLVTITNAGLVGIGTSIPNTLLTLGDGVTNQDMLFFNSARAWKFRATGSGGSTSLDLKSMTAGKAFSISSSDDNLLFNFTVNTSAPTFGSASTSVIGFMGSGSSLDAGFSRLSSNKIAVGNGSSGDFTGTLIAGNIGVGTTTPTVRLSVVGAAGNNDIFNAASSSGTSYLKVAQSGLTTINQLTVNATTTLNSATTTINGVTYFWPNALPIGSKILQSDASGNLSWVTDQTGGGGSVSGGLTGYVTTWASSTQITYGRLIDNGTVAGMNATSSTISFNLQSTAGNLDPFNVSSSSGTSYLRVTQNGNVGIGTTTPIALLSLPTGTTAANGINFGDGSANLYRSAASTLTTDGNFSLGAGKILRADIIRENGGSIAIEPSSTRQAYFSSTSAIFQQSSYNFGANFTNLNSTLTARSASTTATFNALEVQKNDGTTIATFQQNGNFNLATLTASSLVMSDAGKNLQSVTLGSGLSFSGSTLSVASSPNANAAWTIGNGLIYNATSTDLVGIGTITPTTTLFVQGKGGTNPFTIASSTGTQLLTVTQAGNVGIGNTTPGSKLTVGAATTALGTAGGANSLLVSHDGSTGAVVAALENRGASASTAGAFLGLYSNDGAAMASGDRLGGFLFGGSSSNSALRNSVLVTGYATENWVDGSAYGSRLAFETTADGGTSRTEKMTILGNGNVGIGTTTPQGILHLSVATGASQLYINGDNSSFAEGVIFQRAGVEKFQVGLAASANNGITGSAQNDTFIRSTGNMLFSAAPLAAHMVITTTGNVGIGTSSPSQLLTVGSNNQFTIQSDGTTTGKRFLVSGGSAASPSFLDQSTGTYGMTPNLGNNRVAFSAAGVEVMSLLNGGNVGIGSITPTSTLFVQGTTTNPILTIASSSGSTLFQITSAGNVNVATLTASSLVMADSGKNLSSVTLGSGLTLSGNVLNSTAANDLWRMGSGLIYNATSTDLVGIGTITPTTTLFVQGKGGVNPFAIASSTGTQLLTVTQDAHLNLGSNITITANGYGVTSGAVGLFGQFTNTAGTAVNINNNGNTMGGTSGTYRVVSVGSPDIFGPSSGSAGLNILETNAIINQTGSATGTSRSIYINPTLTKASDFRALEVAPYNYNLSASASTTLFGSIFNAYSIASGSAATINAASLVTINGVPFASTTGSQALTITSSTALSVLGGTTTSTTNATALYVTAPTGATNNYAALFMGGSVGIGTSSPNYKLDVTDGSLSLSKSGFNHGMTSLASSSTFGLFGVYGANGGLAVTGLTSGSGSAMQLNGYLGNSNAGSTSFELNAGQRSGTSNIAIGSDQYVLKVRNGNTDLLSMLGNGNLGIGTTSPTALLNLETTSSTLPLLKVATSTNQGIFVINSSGNVGIGTTSPGTKLHLLVSGITPNLSSTDMVISDTGSSQAGTLTLLGATNNEAQIYFGDSNSIQKGSIIYSNVTNSLSFGANSSSNRLLIDSNGNVGIGTTTPNSRLTVTSSGTTNPFIISSSSGTTLISADYLGNFNLATLTASSLVMSDAGKNLQSVTLGTGLSLSSGTLSVTSSPNANAAWTIGNGLIYNATSTDLVGIGTITPTTTLFVQGKGGTNPFAVVSSTGTSLFTVAQNGNAAVGVGSLTVANAVNIGSGWNVDWSGGTAIQGSSGGALHFFAGNSSGGADKLTIMASGNIGIGTTSPLAILQIHQDASSTANSTLYTVASTTPVLQLGQKSLTSPSANGTYLALNTPASFSGDLFNLQVNGTSKLKYSLVGGSGGNELVLAGRLLFSNTNNIQAAFGAGLSLSGGQSGSSSGGAIIDLNNGNGNNVFSSAQLVLIKDTGSFTPGGAGTFASLEVQGYGINQTSSASGITRGIYLNQRAVTSAFDFRNFETSSTPVTLSTSTNIFTAYNVLFNPITYTSASSSQYSLAQASTLNIAGAPIGTTASTTIASSTGITIQGNALTNVTNGIGLYVSAPTGATNNYAALFMGGSVGIGSSSPNATLSIRGSGAINPLEVSSSSGTSLLTLDTSGNILNNGSISAGSHITLTNTSAGYRLRGGNSVISSPADGKFLFSDSTFLGNGTLIAQSAGLGSTTPYSTLVVQGTSSSPTLPILTVASSSGASYLTVTASGNVGINTSSPSGIFTIASSTSSTIPSLLTVLPTGNVGIGVSNPSSFVLDVNGDTRVRTISSTISGNVLGATGFFGNVSFTSVSAAGAVIFNTGSSTNSSTVKLTSTTTLASSYTLTLPTTTPVAGNAILTDANGNLYYGTAGSITGTGTNGYVTRWLTATTQGTGVLIDNGTVAGVNATSSTITFNLQGNAGSSDIFNVASSSGTSILTVKANSRLGFNSSTPTSLFVVQGTNLDGNTTTPIFTVASSSNDQLFTVLANGNVGIGIANPTSNFQIFKTLSAGNLTGSFTNNGGAGSSKAQFDFGTNSSVLSIISNNGTAGSPLEPAGGVAITTNGGGIRMSAYQNSIDFGIRNSGPTYTRALYIDTSTNVAVGTSTVVAKLSVVNTATTTVDILDLASSSGTSFLRVTQAGNVGIGTTTPLAVLQIHQDASSTASSTLYTVASTTPVLQLGQKFFQNVNSNYSNFGMANGTYLAVNAPSSFSGNILTFQSNDTPTFRVDKSGNVDTAGQFNIFANPYNNGTNTTYYNLGMITNAGAYTMVAQGGNGYDFNMATRNGHNGSSGSTGLLSLNNNGGGGFVPTSGNANFSVLGLNYTGINQTSSASGITRGLYLNNGITAAFDYRNIETSSTPVTLSTSTNISTAYNVLFNPITYTSASSVNYSLAQASTLNIAGAPIGTTASTTIASSTGITIQGNALTNVTNGIGLYVSAPTGASNNYAALFNGKVGVNVAAPTYGLQVGGSGSSGSFINNALAYFGGSGTNIFSIVVDRNSVDTLQMGVNKSTATGNIPASAVFLSSYNSNSQIAIGRGGSNGMPNYADIFINGSGNVGINTTSPTATLFVQGTGTTPTLIVASSSGSSYLTVASNGSTTLSTLAVTNCDVKADSTGQLYCGTDATGGSGSISTSTAAQIGKLAVWTGTGTLGNSIIFDNGSVAGVNATSSTVSFNVQGTGALNPFNVASSTGTSILQVLATNSVKLGIDASSTVSSVTASTTPVLQLGSAALSSPASGGTYLGINSPASFSGNFVSFQKNGTNAFVVDSSGGVTVYQGNMFLGNGTVSSNNVPISITGTALNNSGYTTSVILQSGTILDTSSNVNYGVKVIGTVNPVSGSSNIQLFGINGTFNQTGSATGTTRGIYLNNTLTSVYDYRNFETSSTLVTLSNYSPTSTLYNILFNPLTYQTASTTKYTIANASTLTIAGAPIASTTSLTITSSTALTILSNAVTASTTNAIGLYVTAPTGATNNYAAIFTGTVGIGSTSPVTTLAVKGSGTTDIFDVSSSSGSSILRVDKFGNIGIGTTTPAAKLSLQNAAGTGYILNIASSSGTSLMTMDASGNINMKGLQNVTWDANDGYGPRITLANNGITIGNNAGGMFNQFLQIYNNIPSANSLISTFYSDRFGTAIGTTTTANAQFTIQGWGANYNEDLFRIASGTTGSVFMDVNSSGNVGIGTSNPQYPLHIVTGGIDTLEVASAGPVMATPISNPSYAFIGEPGTGMGRPSAFNLTFSTNATERIRIDSNGNVGIGTTSPSSKLTVWGTGTGINRLVNFVNSASTTIFSMLENGNLGIGPSAPLNPQSMLSLSNILSFGNLDSYSKYGILVYDQSTAASSTGLGYTSDGLTFNSNGYRFDINAANTAMKILSSGNVGINTSTPNAILSVQGNSSYPTSTIFSVASTSGTQILTVASNGGVGINNVLNPAFTLDVNGSGRFSSQLLVGNVTDINLPSTMAVRTAYSSVPSTDGMIAVYATDTPAVDVGGTITLGGRADTAGRTFAGIAGLKENSTGSDYSGYLALYTRANGSAPTEKLRITSGGNLGLGTTTPVYKLQVVGGDINIDSHGGNGNYRFDSNGTFKGLIGYNGTTNNVDIYTSFSGSLPVASFSSGGNVGINTTTPVAKLALQGTAGNNPMLDIASSTGTSVLRVTASGNVGIGTTSPTARLEVGLSTDTTAAAGMKVGGIGIYRNSGSELTLDGAVTVTNYLGVSSTLYTNGVFQQNNASGFSYFSNSLGIGTATPASKLLIQNTAGTTDVMRIASSSGTTLVYVSAFGGFVQNISSSTAINIMDGSTTPSSVFVVDTTQSSNNAGLDITAGGSQTGNLLNFYSSGGAQMLAITSAGGIAQNISSTTALQIQNGSGINIFSVNSVSGVINIATTASTSIASVMSQDGNMTIGDDGLTGSADGRIWIRSRGMTFRFNSTATSSDYSEFFYQMSTTTQEVGTLITQDTSTTSPILETGLVRVATTSYDSKLIGVVTDRGLGYNNPDDTRQFKPNFVNVGMLGHIPVKVTNENGPVKQGDYLTSSKEFPGYAMKATRSGQVIGMALEDFDPTASSSIMSGLTSTTSTSTSSVQSASPIGGKVMTLVKSEYKVINNTFVLGENDGQITSATSTQGVAQASPGFVIDQKGSGNILQLQANGIDKLVVDNSGAAILYGSSSSTAPVLSVVTASTTVFSISVNGDVTAKGKITVGHDTAGTAKIKAGDNMTTVTFTTPYNSAPKIIASPVDVPVMYAVKNITATGFSIIITSPAAGDINFNWFAVEQPQETLSVSGQDLSVVNLGGNTSGGGSGGGNSSPAPTPTPTPDAGTVAPQPGSGQIAGTSTPPSSDPTPTPTPTDVPTPTPTDIPPVTDAGTTPTTP